LNSGKASKRTPVEKKSVSPTPPPPAEATVPIVVGKGTSLGDEAVPTSGGDADFGSSASLQVEAVGNRHGCEQLEDEAVGCAVAMKPQISSEDMRREGPCSPNRSAYHVAQTPDAPTSGPKTRSRRPSGGCSSERKAELDNEPMAGCQGTAPVVPSLALPQTSDEPPVGEDEDELEHSPPSGFDSDGLEDSTSSSDLSGDSIDSEGAGDEGTDGTRFDSRKRKVSGGSEGKPRRSRRLGESPLSPSKSGDGADDDDVGVPEQALITVPRSPSPSKTSPSRSPTSGGVVSPPLVGPYSPPACKLRRNSISTPLSPVPLPRMVWAAGPVEKPVVSDKDQELLRDHEIWLQAQLTVLSSCAPSKGASFDANDSADSDNSDEDSETEAANCGGGKASGGNSATVVTSKYFQDIMDRFEDCKRLNHLPTLNLVFTIFETLLLIGNKRSLNVMLRKNNLPRLLAAMQYNPKLNAHVGTRGDYVTTMGKRISAVPLPVSITDLITSVYQLMYLKDSIIPVVCDETRYLNLNIHIMRTKSKLCQAVFEDRRLLPQLFNDLKDTGSALSDAKKLDYMRFLKEFLDLGITSYSGDGAYFWRGMIQDYDMVTLLTGLLGHPCEALRRSAIDICLLMIEEESRKILYAILPQNTQFLRRLFDVFCNTKSEDSTILQLQATLPMLVANPHMDTIPVFYDAAEQVMASWMDTQQTTGHFPPHGHICAFMEMVSLTVHHHHRTFFYSHPGCVVTMVNFISTVWNNYERLPSSVLVATNKGILSILHIAENAFHSYVVQAGVFAGILRAFNDANNLMTSSILTLLHTILQLEIQPLIDHICQLWFEEPGHSASPNLNASSFVRHLFAERHASKLKGSNMPA
jgi:hypothetical protein